MNKSKALEQIARHNGIEYQTEILVKECNNLIDSIKLFKLCNFEQMTDVSKVNSMFNNMVDVQIAIEQFQYLLGFDDVDFNLVRRRKLDNQLHNI